MIIRLSLYILGCVLGCKHHNNLIINLICGAGGSIELNLKDFIKNHINLIYKHLQKSKTPYKFTQTLILSKNGGVVKAYYSPLLLVLSLR